MAQGAVLKCWVEMRWTHVETAAWPRTQPGGNSTATAGHPTEPMQVCPLVTTPQHFTHANTKMTEAATATTPWSLDPALPLPPVELGDCSLTSQRCPALCYRALGKAGAFHFPQALLCARSAFIFLRSITSNSRTS